LYFADWSLVPDADRPRVLGDDPTRVSDGTPVVVDDAMRPVEPWCTFLRLYSENISRKSAEAYALDAARFARFLDERDLDVLDVRQSDLVAYRKHRLGTGLSTRSWARELVVIRSLFNFLYTTGQRSSVPWIRVGSRSFVTPGSPTTDMDVRALSHSQWIALRDNGFGGQLPDGAMDPSFRGQCTVRNATAAELAVTSGMRLNEWRTLLDVEVTAVGAGTFVVLEACAKNRRRRRAYIPASSVKAIELYRATERKSVIRKAQPSLRKRLSTMAVIEDFDAVAGKLSYRAEGRLVRLPVAAIPPKTRRLLVEVKKDGWVEPLSLFVGRGGLPPSERRWHQYFEGANARLATFEGQIPSMPITVTTHDLRHTFAIVMLRSLQLRAAQLERSRPKTGAGTLSEHIVHNPLLTLQRLLGHASPATTMVYLRYIDESDELIQRAFESWSDHEKDYASYVLEQLEEQGR